MYDDRQVMKNINIGSCTVGHLRSSGNTKLTTQSRQRWITIRYQGELAPSTTMALLSAWTYWAMSTKKA
eukprot:CAMPEP_0119479120 /NCGR_PEP_ID=MMETSP1344-20130328/8540_1 /TAXON_ID=236787 /ORGANISM="Florenciella parvula, Strain CCMP2471" /LENGTH=68 /DNA_ID=CAMNT_0007513335 /DNA_START=258 /DNA_END=464 /DNA_ORIENTATION=+